MQLYTVRFIRRGQDPDEEYYYNTLESAKDHFMLFNDYDEDEAEMYSRITLEDDNGSILSVIEI